MRGLVGAWACGRVGSWALGARGLVDMCRGEYDLGQNDR